ncbi:hypothetical protein [Crinalium epipsammum]|nr:hypothetical protein [Crinalium epipsammum]
MTTVNGKLILEEHNKLDKITQKVDNLNQSWQKLEVQLTLLSQEQKTEYLKQINFVKIDLKRLENLYQKLLIVMVVSTVGLVSVYVWLGFNYPSAHQQTQEQVLPQQ